MRVTEIIAKKRDGGKLGRREIRFMVEGYTRGSIDDDRMAAFLMAVFLRGMSKREILDLTLCMAESGGRGALPELEGLRYVDKHSTGGVGDKTTLVVAPMVAAAGAPVAKMSGRGLGHTGGTVDKLESIPGYRTELDLEEFIANVMEIGISLVGQSESLAPADRKIYALRDRTATVESIPLIASSIMSKKLVCGADAIVLNVTVGSGAFTRDMDSALELARTMVEIGTGAGRETVALITSMEQPLGYAVGNSLEVAEAIRALQGKGPRDLMEVCFRLGGLMLELAGVVQTSNQGIEKCMEAIASGRARKKFSRLVERQGGDPGVAGNPRLLPVSGKIMPLLSEREGHVQRLDALLVGKSATLLGAGRERKGEEVDHSVGIILRKKVGNRVRRGDTLALIHYSDRSRLKEASRLLGEAYTIGKERIKAPSSIKALVTKEGVFPSGSVQREGS
jgi:pyrimidine-nucleoside phosphorylase